MRMLHEPVAAAVAIAVTAAVLGLPRVATADCAGNSNSLNQYVFAVAGDGSMGYCLAAGGGSQALASTNPWGGFTTAVGASTDAYPTVASGYAASAFGAYARA